MPGRPCGADFHNFWRVGSYRRRNHPCQISSRSVKGFRVYGYPKSGVSHWLWSSPLQQCYALPCYTVMQPHYCVKQFLWKLQFSLYCLYWNQTKHGNLTFQTVTVYLKTCSKCSVFSVQLQVLLGVLRRDCTISQSLLTQCLDSQFIVHGNFTHDSWNQLTSGYA